jgi:hypothetical protein
MTMNTKSTVLFLVLALILVLAWPALAESDPPRFAIHRVDLPDDLPRDPCFLTQERILDVATLREPPVLTEEHIVDFCWDTQRVTLTVEGAARWDSQGGFNVSLAGQPLLVCLDGSPRYAAMLWNPLSSRGCLLPMIWCRAMENRITIGGRFVSSEGDTILAANYDPEVERVLKELDKLTDPCPE